MRTDELLKLAKKGKLGELETAWIAAVTDEAAEPTDLLRVPELLVGRGHADVADSLVWYMIDALRESGRAAQAFEAARRCVAILPESEMLREALAELWAEAAGHEQGVADLVQITVGSERLPLPDAVAALANLLSLRPGTYVLDPQAGRVGRVEGVAEGSGEILVSFGDGQRAYGVGLTGRLQRVAPDDFRALVTFESERLSALAREDPEELVQLALTTLDRRMKVRRLRIYLEPVVEPWQKWWAGARAVFKRSSRIGITEGKSPAVFLRMEPLSHGQRLARRFDSARGPLRRLAAALEMLREGRKHGSVEEKALQRVGEGVAEMARGTSAGPHLRCAAAAVAEAFQRQAPGLALDAPAAAEVAGATMADPAGFAGTVADEEVMLCVVEALRRGAVDGWQGFCAGLFAAAPPGVCSAAAGALDAAGARELLAETRHRVLTAVDASAGALIWLWRECAGDEPSPGVHPADVAVQMLSAMAGLARAADLTEAERKTRMGDLRRALFMRDGTVLRRALGRAGSDRLRRIRFLSVRNPGITDVRRMDLEEMLLSIGPKLFARKVPPWEEAHVYTTEGGLAKRRAELENIVHVQLPQVVREVGEAAAFGDVSDNAEYRAAIERRARLSEQAARVQQEMAGARIITPQMASAPHVTVGSRVRVRNVETGREEVMTFLGPWDARPEEGVYAYDARLGLAFMGKETGDVVEFGMGAQLRRWEVLEISAAI